MVGLLTGSGSDRDSIHSRTISATEIRHLGHKSRTARRWCVSPKSAQRFWENDMHQNKDLKRVAGIRSARRALVPAILRARRFSTLLKSKRGPVSIASNVAHA
ncbi:MAG: hypothetical protein E5Y01_11745 [Mesorhizobium sp.]|nr:MAG: hypothetical protein EOR74_16585 [Mesorhizobium sp.]RWM40607.1 MAG: hypothetical protein EOR75_08340 [Mesorhizobium sp.]TJV52333.1 MAG: hypothetical protein E5Y01_11745 [Mesorhizobium sp.]